MYDRVGANTGIAPPDNEALAGYLGSEAGFEGANDLAGEGETG